MAIRAILACLVVASLPALVTGQEDELAKARKAVQAATQRAEMAEEELAAAYSLLRGDFDFVKSDRWVHLTGPYLQALRSAAEKAAEPDIDLAGALRTWFGDIGLLSPNGSAILAREAARELEKALEADHDLPDFRHVLDRAALLMFPDDDFDKCWESALPSLDVAPRHEDARQVLEEARRVLAELEARETVPDAGGLPPGMVLVPKGKYKAGPWNGWDRDIKPNNAMTERVDAFYMDVHEVTNAEFLEFLSGLENRQLADTYLPHGFERGADQEITIAEDSGKRPVRGVTFEAARAYAKAQGKRLPTEAEWEWAARGPDTFAWPWGNEFDENATNFKGTGLGRPTDVGASAKDKSPFGIMDMGGNVSEMTANLLGRKLAKRRLKPEDQIIYRGGNYDESGETARTTYRWVLNAVGGKELHVGFRCVISEKAWKR